MTKRLAFLVLLAFLAGSAHGQDFEIPIIPSIRVLLDTPWLLSHGWKLVDTVKWKPYYVPKQKHSHITDKQIHGFLDIKSWVPPPGTTIFHNSDSSLTIISSSSGRRTEVPKPQLTHGFGVTITGNSPNTIWSNGKRERMDTADAFKYYWALPLPEYPWWKKGLWMILGMVVWIIGTVIFIALQPVEKIQSNE